MFVQHTCESRALFVDSPDDFRIGTTDVLQCAAARRSLGTECGAETPCVESGDIGQLCSNPVFGRPWRDGTLNNDQVTGSQSLADVRDDRIENRQVWFVVLGNRCRDDDDVDRRVSGRTRGVGRRTQRTGVDLLGDQVRKPGLAFDVTVAVVDGPDNVRIDIGPDDVARHLRIHTGEREPHLAEAVDGDGNLATCERLTNNFVGH